MDLKQLAADMAKFWISENAIIIDTETTGLSNTDEIVEISAIDCQGNLLLDTMVRPMGEISEEARAVHGISEQDCAHSPWFDQVLGDLTGIIHNRTVVMYNAAFDSRLIHQSAVRHNRTAPRMSAHCAMNNYARFHGEWDNKRGRYKWQSLENAARQMGVAIEGNAHRALTDCQTTLGVIKAIAAYTPAHA
ncbi:MAG: putative exodeoxyribonuclease [Prokaryotic dsDNA virus sp.]|nr:MAG: putative exodeoxyribonuclease [Prokaryotic dsDNA virus sp.]